MRVLVAGGTGFVGGHIARSFVERGEDVSALVRSRNRGESDERLRRVRLHEGTLGAPGEALTGPYDLVVYAAGVWRRDDRSMPGEIAHRCDEVYLRGVQTLAERALAWNAHFVFLSGISRYGDVAFDRPVTEDQAPGHLSIYGAHKRKSEAILQGLGARGLRWTAVAPPEIYGSHDAGGYVRFVYERVRSRRFVLLGDGENRWPFCNVRNVVDLVHHVAGGDGVGVLHVADAQEWSQREVAAALARALDRRPWFPRVPAHVALAAARLNARIPRLPGAPPPFSPAHVRVRTATLSLDTSRARGLGFVPRHGLEEGILEAVRWWEQSASA